MPKAADRDEYLASMQHELRTTITTLNQLYHPVHPVDPDRMKVLEARVAELKQAIADRRRELAATANA